MKKIFLAIVMITMANLIIAAELSIDEIITKIDQTERVKSAISTSSQTIVTSSGKTRTMEMESYSKDMNDKQLMIYTAPRRVKGDKILMLNDGDDIWFFTPKTNRVRHLASHAKRKKVQGSDFSYEDMSGGKIQENYNYKLIGSEEVAKNECYKIELIPKPSGPHYSKMILWADKEKFISRKIDYYEDDELIKRLILSEIEEIDGNWTAKKMVMKDLINGGETTMQVSKIQFDVEIDDSVFTTNNLKKH